METRTVRWLLLILISSVSLMAQQSSPDDQTGTAGNLAERLGYPADAKLLIVHADDIGLSHSVNRASIAALETGLVNSGSIMVPCPWLPEIAAYASAHPNHDLGLHLTLTSEWKHFRWSGVLGKLETPSLHDAWGFLHADTPEVAQKADLGEVEREIRAQIERALVFGIRPTHLDSHMGSLFATPGLLDIYLRVGRDYNLPVMLPRDALQARAPELLARLPADLPLIDHLAMVTTLVPTDQWSAYYTRVLESLEPGVTEIILHLAYDDAEMQSVTLDHPEYGAAWRQRDFDFFTSERFAELLKANSIHLITWREIGKLQ